MDVSSIMQIIGTVGFPIAAYLLMWQQNNKTINELRDTVDRNTQATLQLIATLKSEGNR